ncbi:FAD/NAD(P)-binding protein [Hoeflea sp. TYP-13]|uniref:FAD/NAD(P)-binding protein n=1 Tax=Hoeflea sp. TYP-13 TaxID=3230023 RepID=UPI0034C6B152
MANTASAETDPMVPQLARVAAKRQDGPDVWTLDLCLEAGTWGGFQPGQFNMLSVFGVGEVPISFSGHPTDTTKIVHTIRAVGPVSRALTELPVDAYLGVRGPYGVGWPMQAAKGQDVLIVAGGLGLAPVRPVLYSLLAERGRYGSVALLYGTRSPKDILFLSELESWRSRFDMQVEVTVDHAGGDWHGRVGVVTKLINRVEFDPDDTVAMICGPEIMMRFAANRLREEGISGDRIFLSMERNMQCAIGLCGHCQMGPVFVCKDGPVFTHDFLRPLMAVKEL